MILRAPSVSQAHTSSQVQFTIKDQRSPSRSSVRPERRVCRPAYAMAAGCNPYPASGSHLPCAGERMGQRNQIFKKTNAELDAPTSLQGCV